MPDRKPTPDILGDILSNANDGDQLEWIKPAPVTKKLTSKSKPAAPKPASAVKKSAAVKVAPAKPVKPEKQAWEYRVISCQDHGGWRPRFVDGAEQPGWTAGPLVAETLQTMGNDGWELAAACSGERMFAQGDRLQLYFKRPK
jgi:hypothetical protein